MKIIFFFIFLLSFLIIEAQNKTELYINTYSNLAIEEMKIYNIPASITLAQAILESGNGESRLALRGNNHFGIKCHNNWEGDTIIEDDDEAGECFRKYLNPSDSYRDHSLFLANGTRYKSLFSLQLNDYKGWAKGLKKAGYATNPKYTSLLIDLIEQYDLTKFDKNINTKYLYFAHSYGLPYLTGLGAYYFKNKSLSVFEINTSFIFSEFNIGYHHSLLNKFYNGVNSGVIYLPIEENKIIPQIAGELIYKNDLVLIRGGIQFTFSHSRYKRIPFFKITYLIK
tara:strand:+ start:2840 stop:3688 length:849 start_codon:yes stop_codon:yes gene_type:complete